MKIPVNKMKLILRPSVNILQNAFAKHNCEIRIVGGAVRDLLMEKIPKDLDFATPATPHQMKSIFTNEKIRLLKTTTGEKHGTFTARIENDNFACSSLRSYKTINGKHTEITFIHDWERDANRRDLTVNAMFLGLDGTVYDYFNGIEHLKERKVQFVESSNDRIEEDPFRIIRYFRFFGMLTNDPHKHDPEAIASIIRNSYRLKEIPVQKTITEFRKILSGNHNFEMLCKMIECGLGDYFGLYREFDCENMAKIYNNVKDTEYHYCLLLAAGMTCEEQVNHFVETLECSNMEKEILLFVIKFRDLFSNIKSLREIKDVLVNMVYPRKKGMKLTLELSKQLLLYTGRKDLLHEVNVNLIPHFPIREHLLVDRVEKKKFLNREMRKLYDLWKESDYALTREELLEKCN